MCHVRSRKNDQEQKKKEKKEKKRKYSGQQQKEIDCDEPHPAPNEKRNPSSGQNGQLVHWWLLIHSGPKNVLKICVLSFCCISGINRRNQS